MEFLSVNYIFIYKDAPMIQSARYFLQTDKLAQNDTSNQDLPTFMHVVKKLLRVLTST